MAASRGVIRADDKAAFVTAFQRIAPIVGGPDAPGDPQARAHVLVEEYVPGWEVAVEGILTDGRLDVIAVFDKPDPLEGPYFPETIYTTPSRLDTAALDAVVASTREVVAALGLRHGPIHAELRGEAGAARVIEIAARSIGGMCSKVLRFGDGSTLEGVILRHALGFVATPPAREADAAGVMMLQAPATGRFESIEGVEDARCVEGIDEIIVSATPGRELAPLPEGFLYLGFLFARASTPQEVERALREAIGRIDVVLETDSVPTAVTRLPIERSRDARANDYRSSQKRSAATSPARASRR
jgi:biotin carboxylase